MIDPLLIHDLIQDDVNWPSQMNSDVAKIAWFARENNISLEDLRQSLEHYVSNHSEKDFDTRLAAMWYETVEKAQRAAKNVAGISGLLDTRMTSPGGHEYAARIFKSREFDPEGRYTVRILQKRQDDQYGNMTGIPNSEYWDGTPGSYYATTLLGWDDNRGSRSDRLYIDFGQNWYIEGVRDLVDEIEEKYEDEIKKELIKKR